MDPNVFKATVLSWESAASQRILLRRVREMGAAHPLRAGYRGSLGSATRRWTGTHLILLGTRLQGPVAAMSLDQVSGTVGSR